MRLVWEASPRRFLVSLAPQAVSAVATGAQLVIARDLIAAVLAAGSGGALGRVSYLLAALIALNLVGSAAALVQNQQQQLLGVIVERHTNSILLDRILAIDLKRFETPEFQDLLRRAMNALGRMIGITASAIGVARSIFLIIGVGAYQFWRSMTPNERQRSYVFGLFTMREYAKELRAFGLAPYLRGLYERLSNERLRELAASLRRRARYSILSSGVSSIVTAMTYGALAYLVIDHRIGLAEAGAAVAASQQLSLQLGSLSSNLSQLYESSLFLEDWERFSSLAAARPPLQAVPTAPFERIELDHVSFRYPPSTPTDGSPPAPSRLALDDVSLEIRAGEVVQDFARFMLTARENIGLGRVERIDDADAIVRAAERAGADSFVSAWPERYETILGPFFMGGRDVSIGQWQRIALARAFFRDAPLVILDEPTAALDARAEHDLFTRMRDLFGGRSVLLISHRFSSVRSADRIYVLHEGRVVEHGSHDELMELGGLYAELFGLQASAYLPGPRAKTA